jgi:hypothetical protein
MISVDSLRNVGASYVDFSEDGKSPTAVIPHKNAPPGVGQLSGSALITGVFSTPATGKSGDMKLGGSPLSVDDLFSKTDGETAAQIKSFEGIPASAVSGNPMQAMSLNDMAAELTMTMLKNALDNKQIEREIKAELAVVQFQNGMKIADMIEERGELAFQKAVTEAVTKVASAIVTIGGQKLGEKLAKPKGKGDDVELAAVDGSGRGGTIKGKKPQLTDAQKMTAQNTGKLTGELLKAMVEATGALVVAHLDL